MSRHRGVTLSINGVEVDYWNAAWIEADGSPASSMGHALRLRWTMAEIEERLAESTETVDPVRTFGDRLGNNFGLWYGRLA